MDSANVMDIMEIKQEIADSQRASTGYFMPIEVADSQQASTGHSMDSANVMDITEIKQEVADSQRASTSHFMPIEVADEEFAPNLQVNDKPQAGQSDEKRAETDGNNNSIGDQVQMTGGTNVAKSRSYYCNPPVMVSRKQTTSAKGVSFRDGIPVQKEVRPVVARCVGRIGTQSARRRDGITSNSKQPPSANGNSIRTISAQFMAPFVTVVRQETPEAFYFDDDDEDDAQMESKQSVDELPAAIDEPATLKAAPSVGNAPNKKFHCSVCNHTYVNRDSMNKHLKSKKHLKNLAK